MPITDEVLDNMVQFDLFKMFKPIIHEMANNFVLHEYADCSEVTHPSIKDVIYVLIQGRVHIIAEERTYKRMKFCIRKQRKQRQKMLANLDKFEECEGQNLEAQGLQKKYNTDFPFDEFTKQDYKVFVEKGKTFGNDKIMTTKGFRPSIGMAIGQTTQIISIPVRVIEEGIKKLANSGENKEKTDFMRNFDWFDNFTQSLKTKYNNVIKKVVFYPGSKLITEGTNEKKAYVIIDGMVRLLCKNSNQKFTVLEYQNDPTKAIRDQEINNNKNDNHPSKDKAMSLGPLI